MHYYLRQDDESYTRYTYEITYSYETEDTDVSILHQNAHDTLLTAYTCYPIGTTVNRRVVKAPLIETIEQFALLDDTLIESHPQPVGTAETNAQVKLTREDVPDDQEYELFIGDPVGSGNPSSIAVDDQPEHGSAEDEQTAQAEPELTQRQQLIGLLLTYPLNDEFVRATKPVLISTIILLQKKVARLSSETLNAIFVRLIDTMIDNPDLTKQEKIQRIQIFMMIYQSIQDK